MKRLTFLTTLMLLISGCACTFSQIPPQYLKVDSTCGAALPDYLSMIQVTHPCGIDTIEQTPTAGTWITEPVTTVAIYARSRLGAETTRMFTVTLLDEQPFTFTILDSTLITDVYENINAVYDMADRMLARQDMWFNSALPDTIQVFDDYANDVLVTWTSPALAFTGEGGRWHTFVNPGDTLIMPAR